MNNSAFRLIQTKMTFEIRTKAIDLLQAKNEIIQLQIEIK